MAETVGSWSLETAVRTLWQEARSEPSEGQRAVAAVLWNRLRVGRWGNTLASVCMAPEYAPSKLFMFSGWNARDPNHAATLALPDNDATLTRLRSLLLVAESASDVTGGALCYYNPKIAPQPPWALVLHFCGQFGNQLFFGDNTVTGARA